MALQFKPELIEKILAGQKTQTRRPVKDGEEWRGDDSVIAVYTSSRKIKWRVGNTYAIVAGRGKRGAGRIKIEWISESRLAGITESDARREGFNSIAEFMGYWNRLYDGTKYASEYNPLVWVIDFELVKESE